MVFGPGRLIDPSKLSTVICSPRKRARRTLELLMSQVGDTESTDNASVSQLELDIDTTEDVAEWSYGDYDGLVTAQIRDLRRSRDLDQSRPWDIWRDGCEGPGSESPAQITERLDRVIERITATQAQGMQQRKACDVLVVAHGHILRAFVKRWLGFALDVPLEMMLEPGGVCGLSYAHGDVAQRAVLVGMSFPTRGSVSASKSESRSGSGSGSSSG